MPLARNWQLTKGRLEVVLRATQGNRNNILYNCPVLKLGPYTQYIVYIIYSSYY